MLRRILIIFWFVVLLGILADTYLYLEHAVRAMAILGFLSLITFAIDRELRTVNLLHWGWLTLGFGMLIGVLGTTATIGDTGGLSGVLFYYNGLLMLLVLIAITLNAIRLFVKR
jgi:hypothetical protein